MSQSWTDSIPTGTDQVSTDLTAMSNNFACLKSLFSGASAPADLVAGMPWFNTTKKNLQIRNQANNAWLAVMYSDNLQKIWVYRNTAPDGWAIDSAVVDVVLALKGGAQAYNCNGGTLAGTWTQPDCTLTLAMEVQELMLTQ
jgi:hypothetical protein